GTVPDPRCIRRYRAARSRLAALRLGVIGQRPRDGLLAGAPAALYSAQQAPDRIGAPDRVFGAVRPPNKDCSSLQQPDPLKLRQRLELDAELAAAEVARPGLDASLLLSTRRTTGGIRAIARQESAGRRVLSRLLRRFHGTVLAPIRQGWQADFISARRHPKPCSTTIFPS